MPGGRSTRRCTRGPACPLASFTRRPSDRTSRYPMAPSVNWSPPGTSVWMTSSVPCPLEPPGRAGLGPPMAPKANSGTRIAATTIAEATAADAIRPARMRRARRDTAASPPFGTAPDGCDPYASRTRPSSSSRAPSWPSVLIGRYLQPAAEAMSGLRQVGLHRALLASHRRTHVGQRQIHPVTKDQGLLLPLREGADGRDEIHVVVEVGR